MVLYKINWPKKNNKYNFHGRWGWRIVTNIYNVHPSSEQINGLFDVSYDKMIYDSTHVGVKSNGEIFFCKNSFNIEKIIVLTDIQIKQFLDKHFIELL